MTYEQLEELANEYIEKLRKSPKPKEQKRFVEIALGQAKCPKCGNANLHLTGMCLYSMPARHEWKCECGETGYLRRAGIPEIDDEDFAIARRILNISEEIAKDGNAGSN